MAEVFLAEDMAYRSDMMGIGNFTQQGKVGIYKREEWKRRRKREVKNGMGPLIAGDSQPSTSSARQAERRGKARNGSMLTRT
jgi:hypothetical protein